MGINPWRFDTAANAGVDAAGARREAFILGAGLRFIFNRMQPRRRSDPTPLPQSALNVLLGVRRLHKDRGFPMVAMPMVTVILKGMMRRVQEEYGEDHPNVLVPKRKEPFTTEILDAIGALPCRGYASADARAQRPLLGQHVFGRALWAMLCVLCAAGLRKSEVARTEGSPAAEARHRRPIAMRRNAIYRIGGRELACPTAEDFRAMGPGDNVIITPPPSKADQWAMVWGASPIYLAPWGPEPRNACRALAAMELGDMVTGEERSRAPLFSPGDVARPSPATPLIRRCARCYGGSCQQRRWSSTAGTARGSTWLVPCSTRGRATARSRPCAAGSRRNPSTSTRA